MFGESREFPHQMALIYDGIHYDALYDIAVGGKEVTLHSAEDKRLFIYVSLVCFQQLISVYQARPSCQHRSQRLAITTPTLRDFH